jgi:hypothetical protein
MKKLILLSCVALIVLTSHADAATKRRYRPVKKRAPVVAPTIKSAAVTPSVTVTNNATPTATALVKPEEKKSDSKILVAVYGGYNTNGQLSEVVAPEILTTWPAVVLMRVWSWDISHPALSMFWVLTTRGNVRP